MVLKSFYTLYNILEHFSYLILSLLSQSEISTSLNILWTVEERPFFSWTFEEENPNLYKCFV